MEEAIEQLQAKDTKERMAGVERLQTLLEQSRKGLSSNEVGNLVDASLVLLKDNNFRVSQGTLQALASAAALAGEHLKLHFNSLLPAIVERLGDGKQPVRDAGRRLLLALMEISSPIIIVERAGNFAWAHKNWRVREEFARSVASAINLFSAAELPFQRMLLPSVLQLLEDSNSSVREAAILCLEEMYRQGGCQFRDELHGHHLRSAQLKDITSRFDKIEPVGSTFETMRKQLGLTNSLSATGQFGLPEPKPFVPVTTVRRSIPKLKGVASDTSSVGGDSDAGEKPVDPIRVYSDKDLTKEIEKAAGLLTPEQDWSVRITAMQRIEGLVAGGASEYGCFLPLMKQLVGPLNIQLSDRRSSIVKQACHLLNLMAMELLSDFEIFAESFIPVLFKLVVITVLVIAESADNCIKTMLRNCRVARVLPKLIECAKHDRNAVLRARCCEYALLVLEQWGDSPEIQRAVELYEDLIKGCVGDAMSEVRASARTCYRVFSKTWPERARRIFATFDASVQRLLNEEDGGFQKRYASPLVRERGSHVQHQQLGQSANFPVASGSHVAVNHPAMSFASTTGSAGRTLSEFGSYAMNNSQQKKSVELRVERSLDSLLQASQQQVNAIENMLRGVEMGEKRASLGGGNGAPVAELNDEVVVSTRARAALRDPVVGGSYRRIHAVSVASRAGIDPPSARDPPHPASAAISNQIVARNLAISAGSFGANANLRSGDDGVGDVTVHNFGVPEIDRGPYLLGWDGDGSSVSSVAGRGRGGLSISGPFGKRVPLDRQSFDGVYGDLRQVKGPTRLSKSNLTDKVGTERRGVEPHGIPGFQRPLLRQSVPGKSPGFTRSSLEENHQMLAHVNALGDTHNYMEGLMSLNDALGEGLSAGADWSARVAAFTFLRNLLQQGSKGLQDINHNFSLVMKLFSAHLDDPHHKVAQAALTTLAELVPACRKPFEAYLERVLPHVFSRLVDAKEVIRQLGTTALEIVGNTYTIDSLLPALLRSLDEQRSPKAKLAVIEFAIAAFAKLALSGEASGGSGLLKLWLAKLGPLVNDKNPKLKERAVAGIISVYSHFDSTTVLNFILSLSIEEQSLLRRALKQYTPRIEVDLMTYLQNRSQRARSKSVNEQAETSDNDPGPVKNPPPTVGIQTSGGNCSSPKSRDCGWRSEGAQSDTILTGNRLVNQSPEIGSKFETCRTLRSGGEISIHEGALPSEMGRTEEVINRNEKSERSAGWLNQARICSLSIDTGHDHGSLFVTDANGLINLEQSISARISPVARMINQPQPDAQVKYDDKVIRKATDKDIAHDSDSLSELFIQMTKLSSTKPSKERQGALHQLLKMSSINDNGIWSSYFHQILTVLFESLDDPDAAIRELSLSVILEMLKNQRDRLVESTESLLEKLLHSIKDADLKVCGAADRCLCVVLTEFDPSRCLMTVVPQLVSEDEKALVTCIGALTKLVSRLPSIELMAQLPTFLPALFEAFGHQNADVRKTVVFCLVDIYIVLGKAFVPYLGSLSSTQLRLVTIYANRISQARTGESLES
ncbi:unnamed protein product [Calypogeia fissa]